MGKQHAYCLALALVLLFLPVGEGFASAQTPEQLVRDFYTWYLKEEFSGKVPEQLDEIFTYVDKEAVTKIRTSQSMFAYFTKRGSYAGEISLFAVQQATAMEYSVFVVPTTLKVTYFNNTHQYIYLIVLVKKSDSDGSFRVVRVLDMYPYM